MSNTLKIIYSTLAVVMAVNTFIFALPIVGQAQSIEKQAIEQAELTATQKAELEKAQKDARLAMYKELKLSTVEKKFVEKYTDKLESFNQTIDKYVNYNKTNGNATVDVTAIYKNMKAIRAITGLTQNEVLTLKDISLKLYLSFNKKLNPTNELRKQVETEMTKNSKYNLYAEENNLTEKYVSEIIRNNSINEKLAEKLFRDKMEDSYKKVMEKYNELTKNNTDQTNAKTINTVIINENTTELNELETHLLVSDKQLTNRKLDQKNSLQLERGMYEVSTSKCDNNRFVQLPTSYVPGDILITNQSKVMYANTFTGHAGLIVNMTQVAEATGSDGKSRLLPLRDWCYKNQLTTVGYVVRANNYKAAQAGSTWLLNRPYPTKQQMATKSIWDISTLYCSQLIWRAYADQGRDIGSIWGYVAPGDIFYDNDTIFIYAWKKY